MKPRSPAATTVSLLLGLTAVMMTCAPQAEEGSAPATAPTAEAAAGGRLADVLDDVELPASFEVESIPAEGGESMTMLFKMSGDRAAMVKMITADGWLILDTHDNHTYAYEEEWGHVMKLPLAAAAEGVWADPRDQVNPEAPILGEETLDGQECWITPSVGPLEGRVWIGKADGLPRQLESDAGIARFVYSRIDRVEDHEFNLPGHLRIIDLEEMIPGKS